jgi:hypothetical protein
MVVDGAFDPDSFLRNATKLEILRSGREHAAFPEALDKIRDALHTSMGLRENSFRVLQGNGADLSRKALLGADGSVHVEATAGSVVGEEQQSNSTLRYEAFVFLEGNGGGFIFGW